MMNDVTNHAAVDNGNTKKRTIKNRFADAADNVCKRFKRIPRVSITRHKKARKNEELIKKQQNKENQIAEENGVETKKKRTIKTRFTTAVGNVHKGMKRLPRMRKHRSKKDKLTAKNVGQESLFNDDLNSDCDVHQNEVVHKDEKKTIKKRLSSAVGTVRNSFRKPSKKQSTVNNEKPESNVVEKKTIKMRLNDAAGNVRQRLSCTEHHKKAEQEDKLITEEMVQETKMSEKSQITEPGMINEVTERKTIKKRISLAVGSVRESFSRHSKVSTAEDKKKEDHVEEDAKKHTVKMRINSAVGSVRQSFKRVSRTSSNKKSRTVSDNEVVTSVEQVKESQHCSTETEHEHDKHTMKRRISSAVESVKDSLHKLPKVSFHKHDKQVEIVNSDIEEKVDSLPVESTFATIEIVSDTKDNSDNIVEETEHEHNKHTMKQRISSAVESVKDSLHKLPKVSFHKHDKQVEIVNSDIEEKVDSLPVESTLAEIEIVSDTKDNSDNIVEETEHQHNKHTMKKRISSAVESVKDSLHKLPNVSFHKHDKQVEIVNSDIEEKVDSLPVESTLAEIEIVSDTKDNSDNIVEETEHQHNKHTMKKRISSAVESVKDSLHKLPKVSFHKHDKQVEIVNSDIEEKVESLPVESTLAEIKIVSDTIDNSDNIVEETEHEHNKHTMKQRISSAVESVKDSLHKLPKMSFHKHDKQVEIVNSGYEEKVDSIPVESTLADTKENSDNIQDNKEKDIVVNPSAVIGVEVKCEECIKMILSDFKNIEAQINTEHSDTAETNDIVDDKACVEDKEESLELKAFIDILDKSPEHEVKLSKMCDQCQTKQTVVLDNEKVNGKDEPIECKNVVSRQNSIIANCAENISTVITESELLVNINTSTSISDDIKTIEIVEIIASKPIEISIETEKCHE